MAETTKKMVVISFDCLASFDVSLIKTLPNFQRVFKEGSYAEHVETIYPSLTYPCHSTIVTGKYPKRHGVINNTLIQPGVASPDWNWFRHAINGTTLYDEVAKAKMTTAALLWPVTGRAKGIRYNLPEIFANRWWQNQIMVSLFSGTPSYQWTLNQKFGHIRNGLNQPALDDFVLQSALYTIREKQPNLTLIHFTDLDSMRHHYGVFSNEATEAIYRHDNRLGQILDAIEETGEYNDTTIVVLGDHAALDENKAIHLNVLLRESGLFKVNSKGKITEWRAYCKSCDGSAYIYIKDKNDYTTKELLKKLLDDLSSNPLNGIERVLTGEEAGEKGADPACAFMLEARLGYYFLEDYVGDYLREVTLENCKNNKKFTLGTHGYSPEKPDYTTFFLMTGKGVRRNEVIPFMRLIDIGPTLARLLGVDLGDTDGQEISPFLKG